MAIEVKGLDKVLEQLKDVEIDEALESELLKECKVFLEEIKANQTVRTGSQKKGWKGSIKRYEGKKAYVISNKNKFFVFEEYGTSFAKHNVGYIERSIDGKVEEVTEAMMRIIERLFE